MTTVTDVVFGAASDGSQGDTVRTAFTKINQNIQALNAGKLETTGGTIDGGLIVNGNPVFKGPTGSGSAGVEVGDETTANAFIDFHSNGSSNEDFDSRIISHGGSTTGTGGGGLIVQAGNVEIQAPVTIDGALYIPNYGASFGANVVLAQGDVWAKTGNVTVGTNVRSNTATLLLQSAAGQNRVLESATGDKPRWMNFIGSNEVESGSNAGTNWILQRFLDDGTWSGHNTIFISRSTGQMSLEARPNWTVTPGGGLATPWDSANLVSPVDTGTAATTKAGRSALGVGLVEVARQTISVGSEVVGLNFPSVFTSEFESYEIIFSEITTNGAAATASVNNSLSLALRFTINNGASWQSDTAYIWQTDYTFFGNTSVSASGAAQSYGSLSTIASGTYGSAGKYSMCGKIDMFPGTKYGVPMFVADMLTVGWNSGANNLMQRARVFYEGSPTPPTGFQVLTAIANGASTGFAGTVSVYGRRKSL